MNYIHSMHIEGFRKFASLDVEFNPKMNILVGENESGKSTILDAIKTVLNQQYRNSDKSILKDLFNKQQVENFYSTPSIDTLPYIQIEMVLCLSAEDPASSYFHGENYGKRSSQPEKFGIRFECKYDQELGAGMEQSIQDGKIPYEYYSLSWTTFSNRPYSLIRRPLKFLYIDVTNGTSAPAFNYYNKALFLSKYDESVRAKAKNTFRDGLEKIFDEANLPPIDQNRKFGIDSKKVILESVLSVYENSIALENRGSGMESLIKTQIALDKRNGLDVVLLEEPENHLSFSTLQQMLQDITARVDNSQILVTTHSNMVASRLNLNNVLWITENGVKKLGNVERHVADFFVRADNNSFLQLLLSKKAFLVEGATEFLLLPKFYEQITGHTLEQDGISIISCNGISYTNYLAIASTTDKRIAVITDNDHKIEKIQSAEKFNSRKQPQRIFVPKSEKDWTWEVCLYNLNKDILEKLIKTKPNAEYRYHDQPYEPVLGKMLNNKVDSAYKMLISGEDFEVPEYVKEAIKWLKE